MIELCGFVKWRGSFCAIKNLRLKSRISCCVLKTCINLLQNEHLYNLITRIRSFFSIRFVDSEQN